MSESSGFDITGNVAETDPFSYISSDAETATFTQAEFTTDFMILVIFGHRKFSAYIVTFGTSESATDFTYFGKSFTLAESIVFDRLFSLIYFEAETIIFSNMFGRGDYLLLPVCACCDLADHIRCFAEAPGRHWRRCVATERARKGG